MTTSATTSAGVIDPTRFNHYILGRKGYWWRQRQIARSVLNTHTTLVPTGNAVGKTYLAAGIILWFLYEHPGSLVIATAPTQTQLEEVLWKEVRRAHTNALAALPGTSYRSPLKIDLGGGWQALGYSTTKTERLSGHHAEHLLAVIDEASGVEPEIIEAIDSLNPSRLLMIGNPLRPDGPFYERCTRATEKPDPLTTVIQVASDTNPDAALPRSARGLADATWLAKARNDYGEGSIWWKSHVLGEFPDEGTDSLISRRWLDLAADATHFKAGPARMAIDLAEGGGGDRSVILVRDDNGVLWLEHSPRWDFEATATKAALLAQRFGVESHRITFDRSGIGSDFANRLAAVGLRGCQPYQGGLGGNKRFSNLRTAAAWAMRWRLDPDYRPTDANGNPRPQPQFAIPARYVAEMRDELQGLRYLPSKSGAVELEPKDELKKRLRKSPDIGDCLLMSFAFP